MLRIALIFVASVYTLIGIAALVIGFVIPWDDPLAAVYAILVGAPWTYLLLGQVDPYAEDYSVGVSIAMVTGAIALNTGLLWWWALTRKRYPR